MDPEKTVRDPTFKTIKGFLSKLERVSEDPALKEQFGRLYIVDCSIRMITSASGLPIFPQRLTLLQLPRH